MHDQTKVARQHAACTTGTQEHLEECGTILVKGFTKVRKLYLADPSHKPPAVHVVVVRWYVLPLIDATIVSIRNV